MAVLATILKWAIFEAFAVLAVLKITVGTITITVTIVKATAMAVISVIIAFAILMTIMAINEIANQHFVFFVAQIIRD